MRPRRYIRRSSQLELATVIKVSEAVSSEIVPERLIDTIMRTALEHAGAERGLLILARGDDYRIEAEAKTSSDQVIVAIRQASVTAADLPNSVLHYVLRTKEVVLLHDASGQNQFAADEYIRGHHARSVLCLPLLKQNRLLGVLYLENSLTPHAFTPARMAVLKLLASEAAISMENTRLYSDLEDREAKIRRLVDANILGIVTWNVDGAILASNEAFLRMVQYDHEDVAAGRVRWWDMTPADWRERAERALAEVIQTGTVQPFESEFFRKDGTRVPVLIGATLFQEGGNDGVAFALDLSKQKQAEAEIRALKDQLYRENLALRDEVDRASDVRGNRRFLQGVEDGSVEDCQSGADRLHGVHHGGDWHRQGTHRPRRPQTIPKGRTCLRQCELCRTGAYSDLIGVVRSRKRSLYRSYTAAARPL